MGGGYFGQSHRLLLEAHFIIRRKTFNLNITLMTGGEVINMM